MQDFLESFPVATFVHIVAVLCVAVLFVVNNGELPEDTALFFAIVEGGNAGVAVGRGLIARRR